MTYKEALLDIDFLSKEFSNKQYHGSDRLGIISFYKEKLQSLLNSLERILKNTEYNIKIEERLNEIPSEIKYFDSQIYNIKEEFKKLVDDYIATNEKIEVKPNTVFNQVETALLIQYLKKNQVFKNEITDTELGKSFNKLTGYSENTLRQSITGSAMKSHSEINVKKDNYTKLEELFKNILSQIEEDKGKIK